MKVLELLELHVLAVMQRPLSSEDRVPIQHREQDTQKRHWRLTGRHTGSRAKNQLPSQSSGQTHDYTQVKTLFVHTRIKLRRQRTAGGWYTQRLIHIVPFRCRPYHHVTILTGKRQVYFLRYLSVTRVLGLATPAQGVAWGLPTPVTDQCLHI